MVQPLVSPLVHMHYLGKLEYCCQHCHALHWLSERLASSSARNPQFGSCCLQGKVAIDFVAHLPADLYKYFASQEVRPVEFHSHIR
jgi:hypothetical protein